MGTITTRKRDDGTFGYSAQIRLKEKGKIVHSESKTFDREQAAKAWLKKRETELAEQGALEKLTEPDLPDPTLSQVIAQYTSESKKNYGKTKEQVLATISASSLGQLKCSEITSTKILSFAQSLGVQPQTVGNYLSHLASVCLVARPAWGYPLNIQAMADARLVCKKLGLTSKSRERSRRPTLAELDLLMEHYSVQKFKRQALIPMQDIILFAIFSTRRQEEITTIIWRDLEVERSEVIVRNMKNPGEKFGNDVTVTIPEPALVIIERQKTKRQAAIFPYNPESISASFTRACKILGIKDLRFHDLRHEGISRLFELGLGIPQVSCTSGHRTWSSLKRYTHIRQVGDKYADWKWFPKRAIVTNKLSKQEERPITIESKMTLGSEVEEPI